MKKVFQNTTTWLYSCPVAHVQRWRWCRRITGDGATEEEEDNGQRQGPFLPHPGKLPGSIYSDSENRIVFISSINIPPTETEMLKPW